MVKKPLVTSRRLSILLFVAGAVFIFFYNFEDFNDAGINAPAYLNTPTYDGSGQLVHPDVVYIPGGWNGHEYWMAMTPYPKSDADYENPSIIVSDDGIVWEEPLGISNPIVPPAAKNNGDVDMLLVDSTMMLYYVEYTGVTKSDFSHIRLLTSTDGVKWIGPTTMTEEPTTVFSIAATEGFCLSPTVLNESGTYYMWYVRNPGCTASNSNVYLRTSSNGITWGPEQLVTFTHPGRVVWHFDVQKEGSKYVMLYASYPVRSSCGNTNLCYAESTDRLHWTVNTTPVLTPNPSGWDNANIYRCSFLIDKKCLRIWYSASSNTSKWHVGYTEGNLTDFLNGQVQVGMKYREK